MTLAISTRRSLRSAASAATIDSHWPPEEPFGRPGVPPELDDDDSELELELADDFWDALAPDDDYEPSPEPGDFWTEQDDL